MGKRSIVDYVLSLDRGGLKRLNCRLDEFERRGKRYTWDGFFELHFDRTTAWGWCNTIFAVLGTVTGLAYGLWSSINDWQGFFWLLLVTSFTTLAGWIAGAFAAALIVGVAIIAIIVGVIWLVVYLISLF